MRGGRNGGGGYNGGSNGGGGGHHHHNSGQQGRRVNPRVQTFDSNGPDVRIRGTAYQINEKYVTLARDATSAGDRVLAESYLQHAEHYQRFINEMTEEFNQYNQQNPQMQPQPQVPPVQVDGNAAVAVAVAPQADGLSDLDQGFLVGPRSNVQPNAADMPQPVVVDGNEQPQPAQGRQQRGGRNFSPRRSETETA
jgi:hypothetical protein